MIVLSVHLAVELPTFIFIRQTRGKQKEQGVNVIQNIVARLTHGEDGQGLAEYALILALIAIVAIIALLFLGGQVSGILSDVGNSV